MSPNCCFSETMGSSLVKSIDFNFCRPHPLFPTLDEGL